MLDYNKMDELPDNSVTESFTGKLTHTTFIKITVFGFGLSVLWACVHSVILPIRLLDFVPEAQKNTYLDLLILAGLFLAMIVQPVAGAISDRSGIKWGRRRPYILLGGLLVLLLLPGIGLTGSYATIFIVYCFLQISSNIAQGPFQGLIPDLIPKERRGTASGWRGLLNLIGSVLIMRLIAPLMDKYFTDNEILGLWLTLGILALILLAVMLATVITVKEKTVNGSSKLPLLSAVLKSFRVDVRARPEFIIFLVACLFIFMAWGTLTGHILYFLTDVVNLPGPATAASNLLIVVGIGLLVSVYPAGRLCDRIGRKPITVTSGFLGALGIAVLYISAFITQNYVHIMLCGGFLGICGGAWVSTQWALATDLVSKGEEARYLGLVNMSVAGAGALSRLMGPVIDYFNGISLNSGYSVMLLVCFICFIAGSILLSKTRAPDLV